MTLEPPHRQLKLPTWLQILLLATLVAAHSQVTLRHWALRLAGIHEGRIESVEVDDQGRLVVHDSFAVYEHRELVGDRLWTGGHAWPIVDNTRSAIVVDGGLAALRERVGRRYWTGSGNPGPVARLVRAVPGLPITPADLLLGFCFLALAIWGWRTKNAGWRDAVPPVPLLVLLAITAISIVPWLRPFDAWRQYLGAEEIAGGWRAGIKEWLQRFEVFAVAYVTFRLAWRDRVFRRRALATLLIVGGVVVAVALFEYRAALTGRSLRGLADVAQVDGTFGFRWNPSRAGEAGSEAGKNVLAVYLLFLLPLAAAVLWRPGGRRRLAAALLVGLGLAVLLQGWLLLAAAVGLLTVACLRREDWAVPATLGGLILALILICLVVDNHGRVLADSVALHRHADTFGLLPMPATGRDETDSPVGWNPWQQKYVEMQAALNGLTWSPLLGHGLGTYQSRINQFYTRGRVPSLWIEKSPANFMERDAHGQFTVAAVETGVLGIAALIWVMLDALRRALRARDAAEDDDRALLTAVVGILLALLAAGFVGAWLLRGLQLLFAAVLALPAAMGSGSVGREHHRLSTEPPASP